MKLLVSLEVQRMNEFLLHKYKMLEAVGLIFWYISSLVVLHS